MQDLVVYAPIQDTPRSVVMIIIIIIGVALDILRRVYVPAGNNGTIYLLI